ncbi:MAG TPA: hypothetical protein PLB66_05045 [Bacteroidales bacterium]|nr:hypothetical protein [Bacteroidales bacterium]
MGFISNTCDALGVSTTMGVLLNGNNASRSFTQTNHRLGLVLKHRIFFEWTNLMTVSRDVVKIFSASVMVMYSVPAALILSNTFCLRSIFFLSLDADQAH